MLFWQNAPPRIGYSKADIESCFDRISHEWLLAHVPMDKTILRKWLKAGFMQQDVLYPTEEGTPQGGIISPVLANLALDGLEAAAAGSLSQAAKRNLPSQPGLFRTVCR